MPTSRRFQFDPPANKHAQPDAAAKESSDSNERVLPFTAEAAPLRSYPDETPPFATMLSQPRMSSANLLRLQRTIGNQAVLRLLNRGGAPAIQRTDVTGQNGSLYKSQPFKNEDGKDGERPTYAEALVHVQPTAGRSAAPWPLSQTSIGKDAQKPGHDGGHVIGLQLGGDDKGYNVVPMLPGFNRGVWRGMEREVAALANATSGLWMSVDMHYKDAVSVMPETFGVDVKDQTKNPPSVYTKVLSQPDDIPEVPELSAQNARYVRNDLTHLSDAEEKERHEMRVAARTKASKEYNFFRIPADVLEQATISSNARSGQKRRRDEAEGVDEEMLSLWVYNFMRDNQHLPPPKDPLYPDDPALRPYEYLDIIRYSERTGNLRIQVGFGPRWDFSKKQRNLILQTNMTRNGGQLKSDDPQDPQQNLSVKGSMNFPEIDHIIPKVSGGSNLYSNARVVSWELNNKEDRIKPLHKLRDLRSDVAPAIKSGLTAKEKAPFIANAFIFHAPPSVTTFSLQDVATWMSTEYNMVPKPAQYSQIRETLDEQVEEGVLEEDGSEYTRVSLPIHEVSMYNDFDPEDEQPNSPAWVEPEQDEEEATSGDNDEENDVESDEETS